MPDVYTILFAFHGGSDPGGDTVGSGDQCSINKAGGLLRGLLKIHAHLGFLEFSGALAKNPDAMKRAEIKGFRMGQTRLYASAR